MSDQNSPDSSVGRGHLDSSVGRGTRIAQSVA